MCYLLCFKLHFPGVVLPILGYIWFSWHFPGSQDSPLLSVPTQAALPKPLCWEPRQGGSKGNSPGQRGSVALPQSCPDLSLARPRAHPEWQQSRVTTATGRAAMGTDWDWLPGLEVLEWHELQGPLKPKPCCESDFLWLNSSALPTSEDILQKLSLSPSLGKWFLV